MNLALWLERAARRWPSAPALLQGEAVLCNYAGFAGAARRLAAEMRADMGIKPGDRVALFLANCPEYLVILYAAWNAGAVVVPINYKLHTREAAWIIADADAACVFADDVAVDELKAACGEENSSPGFMPAGKLELFSGDCAEANPVEPRAASDLAWLFYTSGTTGKPKGVMMTHGNLQAMALAYFADVDEVRHGDAALYAAPMSHGAGIYNFMHVLRGARHVVPSSGGFDPAEIIALAPSLGDVHMFAAPTMVTRLLSAARKAAYRGDGIRTIVYGGGPMYLADISNALDWFGDRFVQIYGQGECPMAITALPREVLAERGHPRWAERAASVGMAQSCVEVAIADDDGTVLPARRGRAGEVIVRGAPVMAGYWRNEAATSATIRDGWLWTGDVGELDEDGFLTLRDRTKDVIISGGSNIYPREVEEALLTHPGVSEVSVVGAPHPDWGEKVVAFVVGEASTGELDAHCQSQIARFKRPRDYVFVPALPKNNYGKVLKTQIRTIYAQSSNEDRT